MVSFRLDNKVAVVTGASRGIGRAIAQTLADRGAEVVLVSRKMEGLTAVADEIAAAGGKALPVVCHMGDISAIRDLCRRVEEKYGRLDILVNNAAANPHFGELDSVDEPAWDKTWEVNVKGPFFLVQNAIPLMKAAGGGAIVNVSSVNGIRPALYQGVYSMTKGALITMTQAYAKELARHKIRVNALLPGLTDTRFASALFKNELIHEAIVKSIPMGRHAEPSEMAGAVLYLVSDASSYTTGACIVCDGGYLV
ncbi:MAG: SDR family oxidoreductase [Deltaproteobacteria bacterium]|jgi:NAD(P)-dependent dehydrogenase (short-subunit alcohol dehydrogenase family)|nr:SDR family oxidoreductase [Deltaproteobacteria bacterium]